MGFYSDDYPDAPNITAANEAGVWANLETSGIQKLVANAIKFGKKIDIQVPIFDKKGNKTGVKDVSWDFAGYSDVDASREEMKFGAEAADFMAGAMLDIQEKHGPGFIAQREKERRLADPTGAAVRDKLGEEALAGLDRGYELDPGMRREIDQASLGHMAATGNILGSGAAVQAGERRGDAAFRQYQQRLANAASFLSGTTPIAQFGQLSGAQQGASPFNPMAIQSSNWVNPAAGGQGQQFAMNTYNQRMNYATQQQPIGYQLLGMAAGGAGGAFGKYATTNWLGGGNDVVQETPPKCHVAREVFGADNPEWLLFYDWKELKAPAWFRKLYNKFSVQIARFISNKPRLKSIIRGWMRSKI